MNSRSKIVLKTFPILVTPALLVVTHTFLTHAYSNRFNLQSNNLRVTTMLLEFLSNLWFVDWWCLGWLDAMKVSHQLFYWHFTRYCLCLLLDTLVSCQFLSKSTVVLITIVALFIQLSTIIYWEYVGLYGKKWGCCETASSVVHGRTPLLYSTKVSFPFSSSPPPHPPILHVCERCLLCVVC